MRISLGGVCFGGGPCLLTIYIVVSIRGRVKQPQPLSCTICTDFPSGPFNNRCAPLRGSDGRHPLLEPPGGCRGRFRAGRLTGARSVVDQQAGPRDPARRPAATRPRPERPASGADPAKAGIGDHRPLDVARQRRLAGRFRPRVARQAAGNPPSGAIVRPSTTFGGHQRPRIGLNPPRHPPAGWLTAPHSTGGSQPRSALRAGSRMARHAPMGRSALGRPWAATRHQRPERPAPAAVGVVRTRCVQAIPHVAGSPATPAGPPCQFPPTPREGETPTAPPCGSRCKIQGVPGQKKKSGSGKSGAGPARAIRSPTRAWLIQEDAW